MTKINTVHSLFRKTDKFYMQ